MADVAVHAPVPVAGRTSRDPRRTARPAPRPPPRGPPPPAPPGPPPPPLPRRVGTAQREDTSVPGAALRFDVNLSILFTELPLLERPAAAAAAGFDAVELWWPFAEPAPPDRELDALHHALDDAGVALVGLNFDAGDMAAGERGLLSRPAGSARFRENIEVAVGFAAATGCTVLNALYGNRDVRAGEAAQRELAVQNLVLAARAAARVGATVVIEALNSVENPDYP